MQDDFDNQLTQMFAKQHEPLVNDEFMRHLMPSLYRQQRKKKIWRGGLVVLTLVVSAVITPWVTQGTLAVTSLTLRIAGASGQQLIDLQKAKEAGSLTDTEYQTQKTKALSGK